MSGRWSHVDTAADPVAGIRSCSSRDSVMTDETAGEETGDSASPLLHTKNTVYSDKTLRLPNEQSMNASNAATTSLKVTNSLSNPSVIVMRLIH